MAEPPYRTNDGRGQFAVEQQQEARSQPGYVNQSLQPSTYPTHVSGSRLQVHPVHSRPSSSGSQRSRDEKNITTRYVAVDDDGGPTYIVVPASVLNEMREGRPRTRPASLVMGSNFRVAGTIPPSVHTIDVSEDEEDYPTENLDQESMRSTTPDSDASIHGVNLNRRFDYMPASMVPMWYIKNPDVEPQGTPGYLCATCSHINFIALFRQQETDVPPKIAQLHHARDTGENGDGECQIRRLVFIMPHTIQDVTLPAGTVHLFEQSSAHGIKAVGCAETGNQYGYPPDCAQCSKLWQIAPPARPDRLRLDPKSHPAV